MEPKFFTFWKSWLWYFEIYKKKSTYFCPKISVTRSLKYYLIKNVEIHLITNKGLSNRIKDYKTYLESNEENKFSQKI